MSDLTTDRNDPRLGHGADKETTNQHEAYLVLSEEERAKGFIRPVRRSYVHVGYNDKTSFKNEIKPLTPEQQERYKDQYVAYVEYDESEQRGAVVGRYFTTEQLEHYKKKGCGTLTTMGQTLAETYARDPKFYGATYCCGCQKHLAVDEFVWDGTQERVGS